MIIIWLADGDGDDWDDYDADEHEDDEDKYISFFWNDTINMQIKALCTRTAPVHCFT